MCSNRSARLSVDASIFRKKACVKACRCATVLEAIVDQRHCIHLSEPLTGEVDTEVGTAAAELGRQHLVAHLLA